jgi:murein DD-endopeptidase MepM/ murein hydrolase activator NlpD
VRRLVSLAALGCGLACAGPAKRPFTLADLGRTDRPIRAAVGGPGPEALRILPDGRLAPAEERATLAPALARFDAALGRARETGDAAAERRAWDGFLAAIDDGLDGAPPPRLDLLRASTACEVGLAGLRERWPTLADEVGGAVSPRLARLEERLATPPDRRARGPAAGRFDPPLEPMVVTSFFGLRDDPFDGRERWHLGVDLQAEEGQAIFAAARGTVVSAGWAGGHGRRVELAHDDGVVTGYSHLSAILVVPGASVEPGQPIGLAGATGRATGPHLHFELWRDGEPQDPLEVLAGGPVEVRAGGYGE